METKPIRVLLVDDEPSVRRGLRMQLELEADITVVGEAGDGAAALTEAIATEPNVIVMDLQMAGVDGIEATVAMQRAQQPVPVIILSLHDSLRMRSAALAAGAHAFVSKHERAGVLVTTIRRVARARADEREEGE